MNRPNSSLVLIASLGLLTAACGGGVTEPEPGTAFSGLRQAESCDDLEASLKEDALIKMHAQIDAQIASIELYGYGYGYGVDEGGWDSGSGSTGTGTGSGTGSSGSGGSSAGGPVPPPDHSETNTQVAGVDEADIVKTDGNYIYLLHGQSLAVLSAWPASELGVQSSLAIEGQPLEMFVAGEQVVVYSMVDGAAIYAAAGLPIRDPYYEYGYYGDYGGYYGYGVSLTKVTVLDLVGTVPTVAKEYYFEGQYSSSRRVGPDVRTVISGGTHGPDLRYYVETYPYPETAEDYIEELEHLRVSNAIAILGSTYSDWLPDAIVRDDAGTRVLPRDCTGYLLPDEGSSAYGLTQVHSITLDALEGDPRSTTIVGATDTVYSSEGSMYLASRAWVEPSLAPETLTTVSLEHTHLHKLDLNADPTTPAYVASGSVAGYVNDQFSLDEHDGVLRIATTEQLSSEGSWTTVNNVFTLANAPGTGTLDVIGEVRGLAPNETIYSTRFIGDRGYVVTFRQVDPLFVLDLADPASPSVLAELKIPGFSEYMHPLGDGHLLTIGQDATEDGQVTGLALQVFDVTDPTAPLLAHKHVFDGGGYSEASYNHKAFTFYNGVLAFPFSGWTETGSYSTLQLFAVDAAAGFTDLGAIDHSAFFSDESAYGYCGGYYGAEVRRGVFIDDLIYSISYGGVIASAVSDPTVPVASVALAAPVNEDYGCY